MNSFRSVKPAVTALVVLVAFLVAFVAFILAPLLLVFVVAGSMWGYERWQKSRRKPGVRSISAPRSLSGEPVSTREAPADQSFGFGAGLGREL